MKTALLWGIGGWLAVVALVWFAHGFNGEVRGVLLGGAVVLGGEFAGFVMARISREDWSWIKR